MRKEFIQTLFYIIGLIGCVNNQTTPPINSSVDIKPEVEKIQNTLKQYEEPSQNFKVLSNKTSRIKGKQGTIILVNPDNLETENGQLLGSTIEIELKELINQEQLLRTNAQTSANGKLLVSGGAYYINMTSAGNTLKLKTGKTLRVEFPMLSNLQMSLFYGQKDSLGLLNWQEANQPFVKRDIQIKPDTVSDTTTNHIESILAYIESDTSAIPSEEEQEALEELKRHSRKYEKLYEAIEINQFGWINCDRFYDNPNKTNLHTTFNQTDSISYAQLYLVFKSINSLMQIQYIHSKEANSKASFINIPIGEKTQLIAYTIKNGKSYVFKKEIMIKSEETISITFEEISEIEIDNFFRLK